MKWQQDETSECRELLSSDGRLLATIDLIEIRDLIGWIIYDKAGQQVALAPNLQRAMEIAEERCGTS